MYKQNFVVVIKCDGKILRECDNDSVFLPFGAEYSIMLKNKDARKASVLIEVDGQNVLNGHNLIMNGNETQEIKGFMRDMSKTNRFRFIEKTKEIQKHRGDKIDDGLVRVTYQFEKQPTVWDNNCFPTKLRGTDSWSGPDTGRWANYTYCFYSSHSTAPNIDEGITVKGTKIDQTFCYGDIGELETSVNTIVLHLLGERKNKPLNTPLTVKSKLSCPTCGRKNRSTNNFCYNCGTYLD